MPKAEGSRKVSAEALLGAAVVVEYEAHKGSLIRGEPVFIHIGEKALVLVPRQPGYPAPESGDVPPVTAYFFDNVDEVQEGIHPEQAVRKFVAQLGSDEVRKTPGETDEPATREWE